MSEPEKANSPDRPLIELRGVTKVYGEGDARVMAPLCDAVLLLVRWNATQQALATHALSQLGQAPGRPVLAVLTGVDPDGH